MTEVSILGTKINAITKKEAVRKLESFVGPETSSTIICTPNTEIVTLARKDIELREILNQHSTLNLADGIGLLWAARFLSLKSPKNPYLRPLVLFIYWIISIILIPITPRALRKPIPERISGSDFVWDVARFAANRKLKIFFCGGAPTIAERCALQLQTEIPELRVAGFYSGDAQKTTVLIDTIRKSKADILFVAFGAPKQEKWLADHLKQTGCKIGMGVGGTFDFIAGTKKRAPLIIQRIGLEWLFRLFQEPWRIKRQLAIPKFMVLVLLSRLKGEDNATREYTA